MTLFLASALCQAHFLTHESETEYHDKDRKLPGMAADLAAGPRTVDLVLWTKACRESGSAEQLPAAVYWG